MQAGAAFLRYPQARNRLNCQHTTVGRGIIFSYFSDLPQGSASRFAVAGSVPSVCLVGMAKLTSRTIKKLPPPTGSGAREVPDDLLKGLVLLVHHSGASTWTVRYRTASGQQKRFTLGKYPALDVGAARKQARAVLSRVAEGEDPQEKKLATRQAEVTDTFPAMAARFVALHCKRHNKAWQPRARFLGIAMKDDGEWEIIPGSAADRWRRRSVSSITKRDIVEFVNGITERGSPIITAKPRTKGSPVTANRTHAILAKCFRWFVEQGALEVSPVVGTKAPNPERSRDRVLDLWEISLVWNAAEALGPTFCACIRLLLLTGARRSEVAEISDSELRDGLWIIPAERSKNGEVHTLPLPEAALEIIAALPRHANGLLLSHNGRTPISGFGKMKRQLDAEVARLAEKQGGLGKGQPVKDWTIHDLRRSVASGMAAIGILPHVVEAVLAHKSGTIKGIAKVYNRYQYLDEKRDALARWESQVRGVMFG